MRRALLLTSLAATVAVTAGAAAPAQERAVRVADSVAIERLRHAMDSALRQLDTSALAPLVTPAFLAVHADGVADGRAAWLAKAGAGGLMPPWMELAEFDVRHVAASDAAVLRTWRSRGRDPERQRETWLRVTQAFVREGGRWRLAGTHATQLYDGAPTSSDGLAEYVGRYEILPGRELAFWVDSGGFVSRSPTGEERLFPAGTGRFRGALPGDTLVFERDGTGAVVGVEARRAGATLGRARRVP
jgi:ketosteroid isomerase-like protein